MKVIKPTVLYLYLTKTWTPEGKQSGLILGGCSFDTVPDSADWDLASGDFTIDFWVKFSDLILTGWKTGVSFVADYNMKKNLRIN